MLGEAWNDSPDLMTRSTVGILPYPRGNKKAANVGGGFDVGHTLNERAKERNGSESISGREMNSFVRPTGPLYRPTLPYATPCSANAAVSPIEPCSGTLAVLPW